VRTENNCQLNWERLKHSCIVPCVFQFQPGTFTTKACKAFLRHGSVSIYPCITSLNVKVKVKVWTLAIAPLTWVRLVTSSALQSRKWRLIGMSQWCRSALYGHPLPAPTDNWTHGAASRHTVAPISHTKPSPRSRSYYLFPVPLRVGGWVDLSTQWVSNLLKVACSGPGVSRTRNLSVTSPMLCQLDHCTHWQYTGYIWCKMMQQ